LTPTTENAELNILKGLHVLRALRIASIMTSIRTDNELVRSKLLLIRVERKPKVKVSSGMK
jgi:hypothetical protein